MWNTDSTWAEAKLTIMDKVKYAVGKAFGKTDSEIENQKFGEFE